MNSLRGIVRDDPGRVLATTALIAILASTIWWFALGPRPSAPARSEPAEQSPPARPLAASPDAKSPGAAPSATGTELCGYGPIPVVDGVPQIPPEIDAASEQLRGELAAELAARPTDRERALGLFLQNGASASAALITERSARGDCGDDDVACKFAADKAAYDSVVQSRRDLVRLATDTTDAQIYALAVYRCGVLAIGDPHSGDCALLSFAQWSRIEPDNVIPWLYLAEDAERHHDQSASEAAPYRAVRSQYSDPHEDQILGLLSADTAAERRPANERNLPVLLAGIQGAVPIPSYVNLVRYCSAGTRRDPNRAQSCADVAAALIKRGRTGIDLAIGGAVVRGLGATTPRLAALQDEADALRWQMSQMEVPIKDPYLLGCDSVSHTRADLADRAQVGESGQLRRALAASGITIRQAAEQWRAANPERVRKQSKDESPAT